MTIDDLFILKKLVKDLKDENSNVDIVVYKKNKEEEDNSWSSDWCKEAANLIWNNYSLTLKYYTLLRNIEACTDDKLILAMIRDLLDNKKDSGGSQEE